MDVYDIVHDAKLQLLNDINAWLKSESEISDDLAEDSNNAFRYEHFMGRKAGFDMARQHVNHIIEQLTRKDKDE